MAKDMPPLPPAALEIVAKRFKILGEPMRLRILSQLQSGEKSVSELVEATEATQANVSRHLSVLASANMVDKRKEGLHAFYFIKDPMIFELCDLVCTGIRKELEQVMGEMKE